MLKFPVRKYDEEAATNNIAIVISDPQYPVAEDRLKPFDGRGPSKKRRFAYLSQPANVKKRFRQMMQSFRLEMLAGKVVVPIFRVHANRRDVCVHKRAGITTSHVYLMCS